MSNKEETTKAKKAKETANKKAKNPEKNDNKQTNHIPKSKEKEENTAIKEANEKSQKEREYIIAIQNLNQKIKSIEQNTKNEENKLKEKNKEKENRLQMLTSSNAKIHETLNLLTEKIENMKRNMETEKQREEQERLEKEKERENNKKGKKKEKLKKVYSGPFAEQDKDIDSKQEIINNLSNENRSLKKSIDHFYEISTHNKFFVELKQKENQKKNLEKEIKGYEEIINKHRKECVKTINKLEKELGTIKNKLYLQNKEYHVKNKEFFYIQSKFSLPKKEDEKYYKEIKNKKNFLDLEKNAYLINPDSERIEQMKENMNKKLELARKVNSGVIEQYELTKLPKIDVNHEGKIISSIFTEEEMEKIKTLFLNQDENNQEKFDQFQAKVIELEKGGQIEDNPGEELKEEFSGIEKELLEQEEVALMEKYKLKNKAFEINKAKQDYRSILTKNINLKREEKSLKEKLERLEFRYRIMVKQQKAYKDMNDYIEGVNNIVTGPNKNQEKKNEENKDNINEDEGQGEEGDDVQNGEEYEDN